MPTKRIFVSCGQRTEEEKTFGQQIIELIEQFDMVGFFAEGAHDPADLNTALFKELQRCDGCVAVLQKRGQVQYENFPVRHRASVWIQQEIAILFYRSFLLERLIPMRIYIEEGIRHEGLTTMSIINPIQFEEKGTVLKDLKSWLAGPTFEEEPVLARRENLFHRRIQAYEEHHWLLLEIIAAHSRNPGDLCNYNIIKIDFGVAFKDMGRIDSEIKNLLNDAIARFQSDGLITVTPSGATGSPTVRIEKQWWDLLIEELRNRARIK